MPRLPDPEMQEESLLISLGVIAARLEMYAERRSAPAAKPEFIKCWCSVEAVGDELYLLGRQDGPGGSATVEVALEGIECASPCGDLIELQSSAQNPSERYHLRGFPSASAQRMWLHVLQNTIGRPADERCLQAARRTPSLLSPANTSGSASPTGSSPPASGAADEENSNPAITDLVRVTIFKKAAGEKLGVTFQRDRHTPVRGVVVASIWSGGIAEQMTSLRPGDIIHAVDGQPVRAVEEAGLLLQRSEGKISLAVLRERPRKCDVVPDTNGDAEPRAVAAKLERLFTNQLPAVLRNLRV